VSVVAADSFTEGVSAVADGAAVAAAHSVADALALGSTGGFFPGGGAEGAFTADGAFTAGVSVAANGAAVAAADSAADALV